MTHSNFVGHNIAQKSQDTTQQ